MCVSIACPMFWQVILKMCEDPDISRSTNVYHMYQVFDLHGSFSLQKLKASRLPPQAFHPGLQWTSQQSAFQLIQWTEVSIVWFFILVARSHALWVLQYEYESFQSIIQVYPLQFEVATFEPIGWWVPAMLDRSGIDLETTCRNAASLGI